MAEKSSSFNQGMKKDIQNAFVTYLGFATAYVFGGAFRTMRSGLNIK
jgi:hypothetical protein